ncbi:hypothetical protein OX284_002265 [Flavobacterium sp. SUN046]|uniref:hypothetical protein n=1 Tax=Flavobacterium sp. SUN046 TaxID=3002440 RepID=UPI002DBC8C33|nr:hypothetical protein [Flavobacterium sp. SUN046]MEC4048240.1 hypothetical protein [Flavobacterium sp. SUN046]
MNITENRVNETLTSLVVAAIKEGIVAAENQLPLGSLTDEERNSFQAIDINNKIFVEDVIVEMGTSGVGIIPEYIKPEYIINDIGLFNQLEEIESGANKLLRRITDLKRIAGSEAYGNALAVYRIYESANRAGIPGAKESYDKLKARFDSQNAGGNRPQATTI